MSLKNEQIGLVLNRSLFRSIVALSGYALITALYQKEIIANFSSHLAGFGDVWQIAWNFWWVKKALLELHHTPFFCDYIFFPEGAVLSFYPLTLANTLPGIPLQKALGLIPAFNVFYLATFVLSGFGTFLLVRHLTEDAGAGFVAGLIYAFAPKRSYSGWSLAVMSSQYLPFMCLYLSKTLQKSRIRYWAAAGVFLWLSSLSSWYYMMMGIMMWAMWQIIHIMQKPYPCLTKRNITGALCGVFLFLVLIFPFISPALQEINAGKTYMELRTTGKFSCDLVSLFLPGEHHPLFGRFSEPYLNRLNTFFLERVNTLGIFPLLSAITALIRVSGRKTRPWWIIGMAFLLLSMGPVLQIMGKGYKSIPMPYSWFKKLPLVSAMRSPTRMNMMVMLCLSVLAGYGMTEIKKILVRFKSSAIWRILFISVCGAIILVEFISWRPALTTPTEWVPDFFRKIGRDEENYAVLELPLASVKNQEPLFFQTIHEKKIMGGYLARYDPAAYAFLQKYALLKTISGIWPGSETSVKNSRSQNLENVPEKAIKNYPLPQNFDFEFGEARILSDEEIKNRLGQDMLGLTLKELQQINVRYIILYKERLTPKQYYYFSSLFQYYLGLPCMDDQFMTVYRIPTVEKSNEKQES